MKKKADITKILNSATEIGAEILDIGEKTIKVANIALAIVQMIRTFVDVPEVVDANPNQKRLFDPTPEKKEPAPTVDVEEVSYSKEDVRKKLAALSNAGHRIEVKAFLNKYGADNLTNLDPANYAAIMADAEALENAI